MVFYIFDSVFVAVSDVAIVFDLLDRLVSVLVIYHFYHFLSRRHHLSYIFFPVKLFLVLA